MNHALITETIVSVVDNFVGNDCHLSAVNVAWHVCCELGYDFDEHGAEIEAIVESYPDFTIAYHTQEPAEPSLPRSSCLLAEDFDDDIPF